MLTIDLPTARRFILGEEAVLSPESYVFVALMSVEEGPNKASFIVLAPDFGPAREGAA